ncbi:hypothetical protein C8J57DRAFT_948254, partial [Mycena rebaudengoi]
CVDCGVFLQCQGCLMERYGLFPLHTVKVQWAKTHWTPTSLASLGCVYQLGHGGDTCPRPAAAICSMVMMGTEYIHNIRFRYYTCEWLDHTNNLEQLMRNTWYLVTTIDPATCATYASLDLLRLLNMVGNINVHDFVGTLERNTDALG